jgi:glycerol-3-phosphate O-acyltransferase
MGNIITTTAMTNTATEAKEDTITISLNRMARMSHLWKKRRKIAKIGPQLRVPWEVVSGSHMMGTILERAAMN